MLIADKKLGYHSVCITKGQNEVPRIIILSCLLFFTAYGVVSAAPVYVTDKLRLGLYEEASSGGKQLRLLASGDRLTILNRTKFHAQVETEDGLIGWTKLGFLVDEVPPSFRTAEMEVQVELLNQRVETAEAGQLLSQQKLAEVEQSLTESKSRSDQATTTIEELKQQQSRLTSDFEMEQEKGKNSVPLLWLFGAAAGTLLFGFLAGLWCLDFISRRRHGGYRVY